MKHLFYIVVMSICTAYCANNTPPKELAQNIKYFRDLAFRESPYADIKGIIELSEQEALTCFHYKIEYDEQDRIIMLSQRVGPNAAVWQADQNRFFVKSPVVKISYTGETEMRTYLDHNLEKHPTRSGVVHEKITFDQQGNRSSLEYLDDDYRPVHNDWGIQKYLWKTTKEFVEELRYDSTSAVVPMRPQLNFYNVRLEYDDKGFCKRFSNHDEHGKLLNADNGMAYDEITYDENGNFTAWKTFDENGNNVINNASGLAQGLNLINDKGRTYLTFYNGLDGQPITSNYGYASLETLYDSIGNVTGWKFYSKDGDLLPTDDKEVYSSKTIYDDKRRRKAYMFLGEDGQLENHSRHGFAKITYKYDDNDRIVEEAFYTKDLNLFFFQPRNAARISYSYDEKGTRLVTYYDASNERIKHE